MKVASRNQIYLDYLLPRDETWGPLEAGIRIDLESNYAVIRPRGAHEPLFPEDVDQTLSSMELRLRPLAVRGSEITARVAERALDRIEVTIWDELDDNADMSEASWMERTTSALERAVNLADTFLAHCRVVANSPFVRAIPRAWREQDGRFYVMAPTTSTWYDGDSGLPLGVLTHGTNALSMSGCILAPESGAAPLSELAQSIRESQDPPVFKALLVDAQRQINEAALREAVLSLATALEVVSNIHLDRSSGASLPNVKAILAMRSVSFAERRFDLLTQELAAGSLRIDRPADYVQVEALYRERNALIHRGSFTAVLANQRHVDRQASVQAMLASANAATEWLGF
jgi:hypothetical protein